MKEKRCKIKKDKDTGIRINSFSITIFAYFFTVMNIESLPPSLSQVKNDNENCDFADTLTSEQIKEIEEGLKDIKQGKVISGEKLWASYGRKVKR